MSWRDVTIRSILRIAVVCLASLLTGGCFGSRTPLAPGLSGSIGAPSQGTLTAGVELPRSGPGFVRYRPSGSAYWGTPELVALVQDAAARVISEAPNGAPLVVGDLSARTGGRIPRHASHRTGRDVDLLWYVTTLQGAPVRNPGFIKIGADGLAEVPETSQFLGLDVRRQWLLFKTLITSENAHVQWLFVSKTVEGLVTAQARALGEPADLVWHAENLMQQPTGAAPHDDHVHVRLACTDAQAVAGCLAGGPHWEWLPPLPTLSAMDDQTVPLIGAEDPWFTAESPTLTPIGSP